MSWQSDGLALQSGFGRFTRNPVFWPESATVKKSLGNGDCCIPVIWNCGATGLTGGGVELAPPPLVSRSALTTRRRIFATAERRMGLINSHREPEMRGQSGQLITTLAYLRETFATYELLPASAQGHEENFSRNHGNHRVALQLQNLPTHALRHGALAIFQACGPTPIPILPCFLGTHTLGRGMRQ